MPRLPQKPPQWLEQLSAFLADEKSSKHGVDMRVVKRHWSEFIDKLTSTEGERPKRPAPKPEETLGRAIGRLSKRTRGEVDLDAVEASIRSNVSDPNPTLGRSISSALHFSSPSASDIESLYSTFQERAEEHDVADAVREPVTSMYNATRLI
jgi:hypothetical protein